MTVHEMKTQQVAVDKIETYPGNARRGNIDLIKESIEENGFYTPLIVQKSTGYILAGNHRFMAAKELAYAKLPVVYLDVEDERARKIVLADNKTSDDATYDIEELVALLQGVDDLAGTGFTEDELDDLIAHGEADDLDALGDEYGDPAEDDLWPTITLKVPKATHQSFWDHLGAEDGDTDAHRLEQMLARMDKFAEAEAAGAGK